ncbi:hypothetical protein BC835DRAFT_582261 [Cytidiella melzeri]|nr:hypothetical protein BC835DRAFT_582261 [Cytidiella melzeri]
MAPLSEMAQVPLLPRKQTNSKAYTTVNSPQLLPTSLHTVETLPTYFQDPYSRCAWIIPVRGAPPFPGCTPASVLDYTRHSEPSSLDLYDVLLPSGPTSKVVHQDSPGTITWTADAIRSLWKFLCSVRDAGHIGAVALSFQCANFFSASLDQSLGQVFAQSQGRDMDSGGKSGSTAKGLRGLDYIKVYVDAPHAPGMRDVLHAWHYECLLPTQLGGDVARLRLLRGARLLLVDESNRGVLTW